jgi:DNA polymerase-3 subunit gamma/tau
MDVLEMDAASQRGIDDVRDLRDHALLQPVGRYKVYIVDEAHQLTDAAWNALLKIVEEPPPHLVFVFCTTAVEKVLPTVRSRCQTFIFTRPRLPELVTDLRWVADGEGFDAPDASLALIARASNGSFRDAVSTLDQLATATGGDLSVQAVLHMLGAVDEEALYRLCDLVIDHDTAGALKTIEELSEQGHDIGRLVIDLLEHLRQLMLVQHLGEVPDSLSVTDEARERLRAQANQMGEATVLRLCDLLAVAVDDMRQGGDPRLPLELALVKVTRPGADLSRESLAYRLELLERRGHAPSGPDPGTVPVSNDPQGVPSGHDPGTVPGTGPGTVTESVPPDLENEPTPPPLELQQLQEAWQRSVLPAVEARSIPTASMLREAHPVALAEERVTVEFSAEAEFHRKLAEEPKNVGILRDALYEVTGRQLTPEFTVGERRDEEAESDDQPAGEEALVTLLKETLDAREVDD